MWHVAIKISVSQSSSTTSTTEYSNLEFKNTPFGVPIMQGGESTHEEMCLSFLVYYPRLEGRALDQCVSSATTQSAGPFLQKYGAYVLLKNNYN